MTIIQNLLNLRTYLKKTELDNHSSEISKTEWNAYFTQYFEASEYF